MNPEHSTPGQDDQGFSPMGQYSQSADDHGDIPQPFHSYGHQAPIPFGLLGFYDSAGPWNQQSSFIAPVTGNYNPGQGVIYRDSKNLPSDCDTSIPPDSGYGSRHPPSEGLPSGVGNDFPDSGRLDNLTLNPTPQMLEHLTQHLTVPMSSLTPHRSNSGSHSCRIDGCTALRKTGSEMTKHQNRHILPFKCDVSSCSRNDKGFGTKNDLQRHKRTVHQQSGGDDQTYYCMLGDCAKKEIPKPWPRADNFRQHLQRVHKIDKRPLEDLSQFLGAPKHQTRDGVALRRNHFDDTNTLMTGIGAFEAFQNFGRVGKDRHGPSDVRRATDRRKQWDSHPSVPSDTVDGADVEIELEPHADDQSTALWTLQLPNRPDVVRRSQQSLQALSSESLGNTSAADRTELPASPSSINLDGGFHAVRPEIHEIVNTIPELLNSRRRAPNDAASIAECLKELFPTQNLSAVARILLDNDTAGSQVDASESKNSLPCGECHKTFSRQCELKKHKKRHEKLYGCTFKDCGKDFGSKNDWKRHESSQHLQLETWSCDYQGCNKICSRRESFKNHLIKEHKQVSGDDLEKLLEKRRLGRHCDRQYWCGFCKKIQTITESNVNCWTMRCDHIDDHICGRNGIEKVPMATWVFLGDHSHPGSPEGQPVTAPEPIQVTSAIEQKSSRPLKRKSHAVDGSRPRKQLLTQAQDGWQCCRCTDPDFSTIVNASCTSCEHRRCSNCHAFSFENKDRERKQPQK